ncbi:MAG TPA: MBL fold metallo-hydrolase [Terriglobales bacterium]|jgi:phosphoribosyl 1,2-cyclic phosphate phosphodiesterase|nr:MBL fold metallo-hydrolase [Terriglobales bacterium]
MKATLTVLGSGTSMGVPTIGCDCRVCHSSDPRDHRTRPSILVEYGGRTVLVDTTPDFRQQAIREQIRRLDAVLYTHAHADHILGLDDLRPLTFHREGKIPLYAHASVAETLQAMFWYIFDGNYKYGGIAQVELNRLEGPVELFGARFEPVEVLHGEQVIHGFRFGAAAYLTDFSRIPEPSFAKLQGLDILFLDALRHRPHPTHSTVENSLKLVERIRPQRTFFTHIAHDLPHEETNRQLPEAVKLSYDGLKLEFEI